MARSISTSLMSSAPSIATTHSPRCSPTVANRPCHRLGWQRSGLSRRLSHTVERDPKTEYPMNRWLAAIPLVFPVLVAAQDFVGSATDDPPRITPEMRAETETIARALEGLTPEGFTKKSLVERYTEANLYEKINGRSELFHSYD